MGYTTNFHGSIAIDPPLSDKEADYLRAFADTRHMDRANGPYHVDSPDKPHEPFGREPDVADYNTPPESQPGLWCQWVPDAEGTALEWDGGEKFYHAAEWMSYLRAHFIALNAAKAFEPASQGFWAPHRMEGTIVAVGEEARDDLWQLKVDEEGVFIRRGAWTEKASEELWGKPEGDEEEDENYEPPYVSDDEAMEHLASNPHSVAWEDAWERVPDFAQAGMADRLASLRDKDVLEESVSRRPRRSPGVDPRAL